MTTRGRAGDTRRRLRARGRAVDVPMPAAELSDTTRGTGETRRASHGAADAAGVQPEAAMRAAVCVRACVGCAYITLLLTF